MKGYKRFFGDRDARVWFAIACVGRSLLDQRKYAEAEAELRLSVEGLIKLGVDEYVVFPLDALGRALLAQDKFSEAEAELHDAVEIRSRLLGDGHKYTCASRYLYKSASARETLSPSNEI